MLENKSIKKTTTVQNRATTTKQKIFKNLKRARNDLGRGGAQAGVGHWLGQDLGFGCVWPEKAQGVGLRLISACRVLWRWRFRTHSLSRRSGAPADGGNTGCSPPIPDPSMVSPSAHWSLHCGWATPSTGSPSFPFLSHPSGAPIRCHFHFSTLPFPMSYTVMGASPVPLGVQGPLPVSCRYPVCEETATPHSPTQPSPSLSLTFLGFNSLNAYWENHSFLWNLLSTANMPVENYFIQNHVWNYLISCNGSRRIN